MHDSSMSRRSAFGIFGGAAAAALAPATVMAAAAGKGGVAGALPTGGHMLAELARRLAVAPRRRGLARVPFMIDRLDLWDHEAAGLLLGYAGQPKQLWESSDLTAPWLNLMREAMNGQVFAHAHADFLAVSATHGTAHLALFDQQAWDKYDLPAVAGAKVVANSFILESLGVSPLDDRQAVNGFFGVGNNNIVTLQKRGAVMVACHDSIHAIARGLASKQGGDPDQIAADLTNHLIAGAILVPSVVAFIVELQAAGFTYAKGS